MTNILKWKRQKS